MSKKTTDLELIELCNQKGFIFVSSAVIKGYVYAYFVCKKHLYRGIQKIEQHNLKRLLKSSDCGCDHRIYTICDLREDKRISSDIEIIGRYINNGTKILCKCKKCDHEWMITPNKLISGRTCPECNRNKNSKRLRKSHSDYCKELREKYPHLEVISQYKGANKSIMYKCKICGNISISTSAQRVLRGESGCHYCNSSQGETEILTYLNKINIEYIREYSFPDCVFEMPLRFDFYLPTYNLCIEYDGEQHYRAAKFGETHSDYLHDFEISLVKDEIKNKYCKDNNINLLRIPYWEFKNIKEKIEETLSKIRNDCNT